jgi:N-acetylglucosaminyl-diphospho-decaprenol L-rhamnosyltransferase
MARVAIAIVTMDTRDDVLACLASLATEGDTEIAVLDNASTDGTVEAIRAAYPEVQVIAQQHRAGFGANNNTLIRATTAPYIYLLNPDTVSEEGSVRRLADVLERERRAAAVAPRVVFGDGRVQDTAWRFPSPLVCLRAAVTLGRGGITQSDSSIPRVVEWAMACALMVRRSALDEVGLFDEGFFMYSEETDLERRLADARWEIRFTPAVTVVHHQGRSTAGVPERRVNEQWRGRERYWLKHHSPLGARVAATAIGVQYALLTAIGTVLLRLPERLRPVPVAPADPATWRLTARNAFRGVQGPGLEELAAEFNSRRAAPDPAA